LERGCPCRVILAWGREKIACLEEWLRSGGLDGDKDVLGLSNDDFGFSGMIHVGRIGKFLLLGKGI